MMNRYIKINDAFESYLNRIIRDCHLKHNDLQNPATINNLAEMIEITLKEIYNPIEFIKNKINIKDAIKESIQNRFFYQEPIYSDQDLDKIDQTFKVLNSHQSHQQRSQEWYKFRWEHLTASDMAKAIGEKGDKSRLELIYQKAMPIEQYIKQRESFSLGNQPAIQHGVCFESVATALYESRNNLKVIEYGCLPHLFINYLAASPDGICDSRDTNPNFHGRMLEIKCPYSRTITGIPKLEYYMQVQLQLEVCDLEYCDFLECDIRTYSNMRDFLDDSPKETNDGFSYTTTRSGHRKGVIYEYMEKGASSSKYKYCPLDYDNNQVSNWIKNTKEEIITGGYCPVGCKYWWLEEYNTTLLKRDPTYFDNIKQKLGDFWDLVVYYRINGLEELEVKLGLRPKPPNQLQMMLETNTDNDDMYFHQITSNLEEQFNNVNFLDTTSDNEKDNEKDNDHLDQECVIDINLENIKQKQKQKKQSAQISNLDFIDINSDNEDTVAEPVIQSPPKKITKTLAFIIPDD
jgi:putative phage-type endonuclease